MSYFRDYEYRNINYADELEGNYEELSEFSDYNSQEQNVTSEPREDRVNLQFENFLIREYVRSSGRNGRINDRKFYYLRLGKEFLIISLVFFICAFFPFVINYFYHITKLV
jgi:hypothetical protein